MHIADGVLAWPVLATTSALGLGGVARGVARLDPASIPRTGLLSATFFVASLVHLPVGPVAWHLLLNGLLGLVLGWAAFPAILAALAVQCGLLGYGGITTVLTNTLVIAGPGVLAGALLAGPLARAEGRQQFWLGFAAGVAGIVGSTLVVAASLAASGELLRDVAKAVIVAHVPLALLEGAVSGVVVSFLGRVRPDVLARALAAGAPVEAGA